MRTYCTRVKGEQNKEKKEHAGERATQQQRNAAWVAWPLTHVHHVQWTSYGDTSKQASEQGSKEAPLTRTKLSLDTHTTQTQTPNNPIDLTNANQSPPG